MEKPEMILFDYGGTLFHENKFDALAGDRALLAHAVRNPNNVTAEDIQTLADTMNRDIGRAGSQNAYLPATEIPNRSFNRFLYEYLGIEFDLSAQEVEQVFFDAAGPGEMAEGIDVLLQWLWEQGIRTGVVSNISFNETTLRRRINSFLPENHFEFVIASSEYVFRKPSHWIFDLALRKAGLPAESVWYCGDNFHCDVLGAQNVGITPVWYLGKPFVPSDEYFEGIKIRHWNELRRQLESL